MAEEEGLGLDPSLIFGEEAVVVVEVVGVEFFLVGREEVGVGFYGVHGVAVFFGGRGIAFIMLWVLDPNRRQVNEMRKAGFMGKGKGEREAGQFSGLAGRRKGHKEGGNFLWCR